MAKPGMRIEIDQTADAASIQWAPRACATSQIVGRPGGRGVRLYFNDAGDVVGLEVLGWSERADAPAEVQVVVQPAQSGELLASAQPFARALADSRSPLPTAQHVPAASESRPPHPPPHNWP